MALRNGVLEVALGVSALVGIAVSVGGCIEDADCGVCDPDNLVLESISGVNYTSDKIHILSPPCEGERCPSHFTKGSYFIEDIGPCEETRQAQATPSPEEYCRLSPLVTASGIEFVFNNLLDAQSIELVRKSPDNPQLFEVYDWKPDVLHVEGPITRWNGDYAPGDETPDVITRMVNLSCVDNLRAAGVEFGNEHYADPATNPCNDMIGDKPVKMFEDGEVHSFRGIWTAWGNNCSSPQEGPDTCCTFCEWLLTTKVERYGVDAGGVPLSPNPGTFDAATGTPYGPAIVCRAGESDGTVVDEISACRGFRPSVDRSDEEQRWTYEWCATEPPTPDCATTAQTFSVPLYDKLRETHPDDRPRFDSKGRPFEKRDAATGGALCRSNTDCEVVHELPGTTCMGLLDDGSNRACRVDAYLDTDEFPNGGCSPDGNGDGPEDVGGYCRPTWVGSCQDDVDTTGGQAYCVDRRFATAGSGACKITTDAVEDGATYGNRAGPNATTGVGYRVGCEDDGTDCAAVAGGGRELSLCDWNENGRLTAAECCVGSIAGPTYAGQGDGFACDPFYQSNLVDKPLYQRDTNLPEPTKNCKCPTDASRTLADYRDELEDDGCFEPVSIGCFDGDGDTPDDERRLRVERAGDYAVKFVARVGGIVYDPALKGIDWRPADVGNVPRADIEQCAMDNVDRLVEAPNRHDGWRAHDPEFIETYEDFDRAMCSGQTYRVVFNEPGEEPWIEDKVGNTLAGKSVYTFETSQFHVVPGSGFPSDNLRIGACEDFSIRFSNKFDVSPENLNKIQLYRVRCTERLENGRNIRECDWAPPDPACDREKPPEGACCDPFPGTEFYPAVAGGPGCYATEDEIEAARIAGDTCARPCLTANVTDQDIGLVHVEIDSTQFGQVLDEDQVYRMFIPSAPTLEAAANDPDLYDAVFWDVCGMPLVDEGAVPYQYEFEIDAPKCKEDEDRDGVPFSCDNADVNFNPLQGDMDLDGIGDVVDLCPVLDSDRNNTADSDNDGVGNDCDSCRRTLDQYNAGADLASIPAYMQVRNIPYQHDVDQDGVGDVCDNCVWVPNCETYGTGGALEPYRVGDPLAVGDDSLCQRDTNGDFIGDACTMVAQRPNAAGPIGFGNDDDFDQDGISNLIDACPRQPLVGDDVIACAGPEDCPADRTCDDGFCNHLDSDGDGVGNLCDTCPFSANYEQTLEGAMQEDDKDEDFVGQACETAPACAERNDPRPFGFYRVQANGNCCVPQLVEAVVDWDNPDDNEEYPLDVFAGDLLLAATCENPEMPSGGTCTALRAPHPDDPLRSLPVRTPEKCVDEQEGGVWKCRRLPPQSAAPGILTAPPGCEEALAAANDGMGMTALENLLQPLTERDFADEPYPFDALWKNMCFLPQVDQDFDGLGDPCDLCKFAFDPENTQYIDAAGRLHPDAGLYCQGSYRIDDICKGLEEIYEGEGGMSDESGSGSDGGSSDGGSDGGTGG